MKKLIKPFSLLMLMFMTTSCYSALEGSSTDNPSNDSSSGATSGEDTSDGSELSDEFDIKCAPLIYYGNPYEPLVITNTDRMDEIEYDYDDEYLDITDNQIKVIKDLEVINPAYYYKQKKEFTIKATLGEVSKYFTVAIKKAVDRENKMASYKTQQTTRGITKNNYTLVMGDSFFDYYYVRGWSQIYQDIGGNIFNSGIAASTFEEWFHYAPSLIYDISPKYIAMHLGTNDFWDLNSTLDENYDKFVAFVETIHYHCPNTKIVYFSIENRGNNMTGKSSAETIATLREFNEKASNYCASHDYITYVDSFTHFTNADGTCKMSLFYDDYVHPLPSGHPFYINKMIEAGIDNIENLASTTPSSFNRTKSQGVTVEPVRIIKNGNVLTKEFVVSGSVSYSYDSGSNAHFEFGIGSHGNNRLLLWNNPTSGNTLYAAAIYGGDYSKVATANGVSGTSGSFTFKLMISNKSAYLFVNDELKGLLYNFIQNNEITLSSELMNVNATNISINTKNDGSNVYEGLLSSVATYESDSSTTTRGIVIN